MCELKPDIGNKTAVVFDFQIYEDTFHLIALAECVGGENIIIEKEVNDQQVNVRAVMSLLENTFKTTGVPGILYLPDSFLLEVEHFARFIADKAITPRTTTIRLKGKIERYFRRQFTQADWRASYLNILNKVETEIKTFKVPAPPYLCTLQTAMHYQAITLDPTLRIKPKEESYG